MTDRDLLLEFVGFFYRRASDKMEAPHNEDVDAFLAQRAPTSNQIEPPCKEAGKSEGREMVLVPRSLLEHIEWRGEGGYWEEAACPNCDASRGAHYHDCELALALGSPRMEPPAEVPPEPVEILEATLDGKYWVEIARRTGSSNSIIAHWDYDLMGYKQWRVRVETTPIV